MNELNQQLLKQWTDAGYPISAFMDEYHSFKDLYTQRMYLTALAFNSNSNIAWKSKQHSECDMFPGYFIVGISTPQGQYAYHYKLEFWDLFKVPELQFAPTWDGHTSKDVERLMSIIVNQNSYFAYPVDRDSALVYFLDNGVQEEVLLPIEQITEFLEDYQDEYIKFVSSGNMQLSDCLLIKAW